MPPQAEVQILDDVLWIKHIRNDTALQAWLADAPAGVLIELEVDGWRAGWLKMADGPDGRPTNGLKPHPHAKRRWDAVRREHGRWVTIKLCEDA